MSRAATNRAATPISNESTHGASSGTSGAAGAASCRGAGAAADLAWASEQQVRLNSNRAIAIFIRSSLLATDYCLLSPSHPQFQLRNRRRHRGGLEILDHVI